MADGSKLAKIAIAHVRNIERGSTLVSDPRVSPLSQSFGVTYDGNNNILNNTTTTRIGSLENDTHTHTNKAILDATNASYTVVINTHIDDLETRLAALELALAAYATHTHNYNDATITDTADGSGASGDTVRTTGGVN